MAFKNHKHKCPVCKKITVCDHEIAKHGENIICQDGYSSFCLNCQNNKFDKVVQILKMENRI